MYKLHVIIFCLIMALVVTACQNNQEPMPTLASLSDNTETEGEPDTENAPPPTSTPADNTETEGEPDINNDTAPTSAPADNNNADTNSTTVTGDMTDPLVVAELLLQASFDGDLEVIQTIACEESQEIIDSYNIDEALAGVPGILGVDLSSLVYTIGSQDDAETVVLVNGEISVDIDASGQTMTQPIPFNEIEITLYAEGNEWKVC